jgi:ribosomal protein S12 methylthiotransferase
VTKKVSIISLGCSKALVDSEQILALFKDSGFELTNEDQDADIIIINTCGFIELARKEARDTITQYLKLNKVTIVVGCYVEKNDEELKRLFPKVSLFIKFSDYDKIPMILQDYLKEPQALSLDNRLINQGTFAYLRIADGCNKRCAYCTIPDIRGKYTSVPINDLIRQAKMIGDQGYQELVLIAQDSTSYGLDLKDNGNLVTLLTKLEQETNFTFIRILYLYPTLVSQELIDVIKNSSVIVPYFDLPLQHVNNRILKLMRRYETKELIISLYEKIKIAIPKAVFRTTFITGFPSETAEEFNEILEFIKKYRFTHLGAFAYSKEANTPAGIMPKQVTSAVKNKRRKELLELQYGLSYLVNQEFVGEVMTAIVEERIDQTTYLVRSYFNAPEDIDGRIILKSNDSLAVGSVIKIKITKAHPYDLEAVKA